MEARLRQALLQAEEVARALADPGVGKDPEKLRFLGREHTRLAPVVRVAPRVLRNNPGAQTRPRGAGTGAHV